MANKKKDSCFSRLIAVSDYIGRCWKKGSGCEEGKVIVLPNCAKIERFNIDTSETEKIELRNKLGIPKNHRVVIFTGRIVKEKGVKELLTAFDQLRTELVTLVIVGSANFGASTNTEYRWCGIYFRRYSFKNTKFCFVFLSAFGLLLLRNFASI